MAKLPLISAVKFIKALEKIGFIAIRQEVNQRFSFIRMGGTSK